MAADAPAGASEIVPPLTKVELQGPRLRVCVTGGAGYIASHIVARLLAIGHTVHATARHPDKRGTVAHLLHMQGAAERLQLFQADLMAPGSFDDAVAGCDAVVHCASPFMVSVPRGKEEERLVQPAVAGTENVLGAVERSSSMRTVILTASTVCVFTDPTERGQGHVFTEGDWNETAILRDYPYYLAKTRAEQLAYELASQQQRWRLCSILPPCVLGPPLSERSDGESVTMFRRLLSGQAWPALPPLGMNAVDVRDVALAHCLALCNPQASGRYLISAADCYPLNMAAMVLRRRYPQCWLPVTVAPLGLTLALGPLSGLPRPVVKALYKKKPRIDTSKAERELRMQYLPLEQTFTDMAEAMLAAGMVPRWQPPPVLVMAAALLVMLAILVHALYRSLERLYQ